ncbi:putative cytochrome p450 family protein [Botrytis fragariae]|uniref:Putative cytochrome p450 family protein n=1 Tax=Botrytis fragariae TaxID=1964551 RepID=A0A8H6ALG2_9HELO|nr:putative cytochrome p450 family protein [Botrytis fragariae]KAF5869440.1 putative cytochrome p450 family protein [Botrytis fragariae]
MDLSYAQVTRSVFMFPTLVFCWVLYCAVSRLFFHPLNGYPGPLLSRLSSLPVLYHAWKGDLHYHLFRLHLKHGKCVRYAPNKLSINDSDAVNEIYGFNKNTAKPEEAYAAFRVNKHAINTFNTSSKEAHRRKRRIMAKGFSDVALATYEESISQPKCVFNWAYEANCLMLDIMGHLCFGAAFGFIGGKGEKLVKSFHQRAFRVYMVPLFKKLYIDRVLFPQMAKANTALADYARSYTVQRAHQHREETNRIDETETYSHVKSGNNNTSSDIMHHLLNAHDEETTSVYSDNELLGEAILLMMAGSDTTSTALTATLFYLFHNPHALQSLRSELAHIFSSSIPTRVLAVENCKYLRACIDEAMRLCPPAPTALPRVVCEGGIEVLGIHFPEGVCLGVPNFALFRNELYFKEPHRFMPERWLNNDEDSLSLARMAFKPFSVGPRHCIGQRLAIQEMAYVIAKIVYHFDFEVVGTDSEYRGLGVDENVVMEQFDVFTSLERGPEINFWAR